ncbi:hypothetical protein QOZ98_001340 [Planomicrobium stackebrandtii]|uniref:Uncharacterized protein n=1 Tax=Planomicrobium stackebrandtii TaxID=253160 RepID=A0ABU0GUA0_9BACL|nr:hypothetical protein [Planomicrobium stackebrandtii]MDQ0428514.1 hypothetical protein [Planomicrobium stackebrandtii]
MNKRVRNTILGTLAFGSIGFIVSYILDGAPDWNVVIGQAIGGFLLYAFLLPALAKKNKNIERGLYGK